MSSYAELQQRIAELQAEAEAIRRQEFGSAIAEIRAKMQELGITVEDLQGGAPRTRRASATPVAAKYRDPASGKTWSGRGRSPVWLAEAEAQGRSRDEFLIG